MFLNTFYGLLLTGFLVWKSVAFEFIVPRLEKHGKKILWRKNIAKHIIIRYSDVAISWHVLLKSWHLYLHVSMLKLVTAVYWQTAWHLYLHVSMLKLVLLTAVYLTNRRRRNKQEKSYCTIEWSGALVVRAWSLESWQNLMSSGSLL